MRSIGAIVVGIGAYRGDPAQYPPLRYASTDADEVFRYLKTCWPKRAATLIHLADDEATLDSVANAFMTLAQEGPYDLQLVFMSGHGSAGAESAGFLLQPPAGASGVILLHPERLDAWLEMARATQTLFILDCCYAEGIARRMRFFTALGESDARLFVASSRETQRTWEDDNIGHGVFTAHLLDLLRTGSSAALNGVRDRLDVDGELFRVLCDQVPLYVLEHQQHQQEPVKGGVSIRPVRLPVARSQRQIQERTAFTAAVRRVRQIAVSVALACLTFPVFTYLLTYYAQADSNGRIHLHHGMSWTAALFRFLPTLRADTGISWTELSDDPAQRYAVQAGAVWGFWTQVSRRGYRAWYDGVRPGLEPHAAARYDVLLAAGGPTPVSRLNDNSRPSEVAFAAWALLDDADVGQIDALFRHVLGADRIEPMLKPFAPNDLDFNILDLLQSQLASHADALRAAAAIDPDRTFVAYIGFLKSNQIWLAHSSPEQRGREAQRRAADDVADVLAVIVRARTDRGKTALDHQQIALLNGLADVGYGLVRLALSRVSAAPSDARAEAARALVAFHGSANEPDEANALRRLKGLLDSSVDSQAMVEKIYQAFVAAGGPQQSDLTAFLIAAAAAMTGDFTASAPPPELDDEPVLEMDEIQGNVIPGFGTLHLELMGLRIGAGQSSAARTWLRELTPLTTTAAHAWHAREVRRAVARTTGIAPPRDGVFLNVLLSHERAALLGLATAGIGDGLFRSGMSHADLHDPADPQGRPIGWKFGDAPETTPHVLILLGADDQAALAEAIQVLIDHLPLSGLEVIYRDAGHRLPGDIEHFGFRDGIAQPGVRGRRDVHPDSLVTRRYIASDDPLSERFSRPGEPLIWPGQFIIGYPTQDEFGDGPGPIAQPSEPWMRNGSFSVVRRLRQHVAAFHKFAADHERSVSAALGREVTREEIEAWLVGRWPNGKPLVRQPQPFVPLSAAGVSRADLEINHFDYAADVPEVRVQAAEGPSVIEGAPADATGERCPHFAHIRKVNLRDKLTDQGPSFRFRMLRRGIPYGPLVQPGAPDDTDRGLLFIAYQRDLQPFLTAATTWMNSAAAPEGFGHDLLVGQNRGGRTAERQGVDGRQATLDAPGDSAWITPTGGGFFFSPAVSVFATL